MTKEEAIKLIEFLGENWHGQSRKALDMAISALREQPRWISVEDRLPEAETEVLAIRTINTMDVEQCNKEGCWTWDGYSKGFVTHWMPLPHTPNGGVAK